MIRLGSLLAASVLAVGLVGCSSVPGGDPTSSGTLSIDNPNADCVTQWPPSPEDPVHITVRQVDGAMTRTLVAADVVRVGLDAQDVMDISRLDQQPDLAGWYCYSPRPGQKGPAVLVGHVDWGGKLRAFGMLKDVKAGDSITVQLAGGRQLEYAVEDVKSIPKDAVTANPDLIYQASGDARLRLVTCGGIFDHSSRSYKNNTIVYARLRGVLP